MSTPLDLIQLTLYDADNEVVRELVRSIVPWGLLKKAMALSDQIEQETALDGQIDLITQFIAAVFEGNVTPEELELYADVGDMIVILQQVMNKAAVLGKKTAGKPRPK